MLVCGKTISSLNVEVVIPALNEPYLPKLLKELRHYKVSLRGEFGLSTAVHNGIQDSHAQVIVVMDGDGSHCPHALPAMIKLLDDKTWLVVGSRYCKNGYSEDSIIRKIVSHFYCFIARIFLRTGIKDCMSGFWVGYRWAFKFQPSQTYKFGLQLIRKYGNKHIKEFGIVFRKRKEGKSHVKPLQSLKDFFAIFRR